MVARPAGAACALPDDEHLPATDTGHRRYGGLAPSVRALAATGGTEVLAFVLQLKVGMTFGADAVKVALEVAAGRAVAHV